jgi:hypothetical protein
MSNSTEGTIDRSDYKGYITMILEDILYRSYGFIVTEGKDHFRPIKIITFTARNSSVEYVIKYYPSHAERLEDTSDGTLYSRYALVMKVQIVRPLPSYAEYRCFYIQHNDTDECLTALEDASGFIIRE